LLIGFPLPLDKDLSSVECLEEVKGRVSVLQLVCLSVCPFFVHLCVWLFAYLKNEKLHWISAV